MKKFLSLIIIFAMVATCCFFASAKDPEPLYGDTDGNGTVDGLDLILFSKYNLALVSAEDCHLENMDLNLDGVVDGLDLIVFAKYNLDLIDSLPAPGSEN